MKTSAAPRARPRFPGLALPFASAHAIYGLSKLAVWWLRLGIQIERIKPGHPQQNQSIDCEDGGIAVRRELSREPHSTWNVEAVPEAAIERTAVKKQNGSVLTGIEFLGIEHGPSQSGGNRITRIVHSKRHFRFAGAH